MSGRKFEVGKTYEGRITKDLYECKFSGEHWVIFGKGSGVECVEMHENIAHYKEVVPKKTGTKFLLVYEYNSEEYSLIFADRHNLNMWATDGRRNIRVLAIKEVPWTEGDGVGETKKD